MKDLSTRQSVPRSPIQVFSKRNTVIGSLASSGQIFKPNGSCTVLYVLVQILSATTIQLQENSAPVSAPYLLPANSIIRFAGRFLSGNEVLSLSLSPSASIVYEIVWLKEFDTTFLVAETQVFIPNPSVTFPNSLTANQGTAQAGAKWSMEIDSPLDSAGNVLTSLEGRKATYKCTSGFGVASAPTDVFFLQGSASKKIKLTQLKFSFLAVTTAGYAQCNLHRRTAANTGGTSVFDTILPVDSTDPPATAVIKHYSANPTALGADAGTLDITQVYCPLNTAQGQIPLNVTDTPGYGQKPITLNNQNEYLCLNLSGTNAVGIFAYITTEWTEE